jgi:hypothetical protein
VGFYDGMIIISLKFDGGSSIWQIEEDEEKYLNDHPI